MGGYIEDSQGKAKFDVNRRRSTALTFVAGLCLGVLASCVYVKQRGGGGTSFGAAQQELVLQQSAVTVRRLDAGSAGASSTSSSSSSSGATSAAHKELEAVLQRIAPDREVGCMHGSCSQSPGQVVVHVFLSQHTVR